MKKIIVSIITIIFLALGFVCGFYFPEFSKNIAWIGEWYIKLLKIIIGPVIFVCISLSILKKKKNSSLIILKTVLLFVIMFAATFLLTSLITVIFRPGAGFEIENAGELPNSADFSILSILNNLRPTSVEGFFTGKNIFFVIVLAVLLGFILSKAELVKDYTKIFEFIKKILDIVLEIIIFITPLGVLSLVSNMVVNYGTMLITTGLKYILFAYISSLVALILIMILPVWIFAKINPITYIRKVAKVWLVSLSTCSSVATLPYTIKTCNEDFGVDEKITNIVVPLGCTIHMCGGAVSFALLGLFVAQMSGVSISFWTFLFMLLSATLINMAAPGIPGGGVIIGLTYLSLLNLPINGFYGFYSGIYKLLDMPYTTLNVTGDITANILLNHQEEKKKYKANARK